MKITSWFSGLVVLLFAVSAPIATVRAQAPAEPLVLEESWSGASPLRWTGSPVIEEKDGRKALKLESKDAAVSVNNLAQLPAEKCKGRKLVISTRVKAEDVSEKPQAYNGIKLMLVTVNAAGVKNYPQIPLPSGTFGWKEVDWVVAVPADAVNVMLFLGLEKVSGKAWFDTLKIVGL